MRQRGHPHQTQQDEGPSLSVSRDIDRLVEAGQAAVSHRDLPQGVGSGPVREKRWGSSAGLSDKSGLSRSEPDQVCG